MPELAQGCDDSPWDADALSANLAVEVVGNRGVRRLRLRRYFRYATTSVVSTAVSEAILMGLYGWHLLPAAGASGAATAAGALPAYAMSRYWIWPEADRRRPARQAGLYWLLALISLVAASAVTGEAARIAPSGATANDLSVAVAYIGTYGSLWVLRFFIYQRVVFVSPAGDAGRAPSWLPGLASESPPRVRRRLGSDASATPAGRPTC